MAECGGSDCLEPQRRVGHWSLYRLFFFFFFRMGECGKAAGGGAVKVCSGS